MARKNLDQILVIDVESTCWEGQPPEGQLNEIIEIGVCLLDIASGERIERESLLVKPESSTISSFCTQLTGLTQEQVDQGVSFNDACGTLRRRFRSKDRVWASYGDYDRRQFERQCERQGLKPPFGPSHINVKTLFALAYALPHEVGMAEALKILGMPLEGMHHRGVDDAWNIAGILHRLLLAARKNLKGDP